MTINTTSAWRPAWCFVSETSAWRDGLDSLTVNKPGGIHFPPGLTQPVTFLSKQKRVPHGAATDEGTRSGQRVQFEWGQTGQQASWHQHCRPALLFVGISLSRW
jgi:hypothetical protein